MKKYRVKTKNLEWFGLEYDDIIYIDEKGRFYYKPMDDLSVFIEDDQIKMILAYHSDWLIELNTTEHFINHPIHSDDVEYIKNNITTRLLVILSQMDFVESKEEKNELIRQHNSLVEQYNENSGGIYQLNKLPLL